MAKKNDVIGFYRVANGVTIPAFKAYLTRPKTTEACEFLSFGNDGNDPAGIVTTMQNDSKPSNNDIYDLTGRRVKSTVSGHLYIRNGKTFVAK